MVFFSKKRKYLFPVIWLVYLAFPVTDILSRHALEKGLGFAVLALFVAAYLLSWWDPARMFYYLFIELVIIAYFTLLWQPSYLYLVFFVTPVIAFLPNPKTFRFHMVLLAVLLAGYFIYASSFLTESDLLNLIPAMIVAVIVPTGIRGGVRSQELKGQLHLANEEIARLSKQEERQRISRNLHDTLGHTLSLIALKSELVEKLINKQPGKAVQEAKDIHWAARAALKQVRELVSDMTSVTIAGEIGHAKQILLAAGIELKVEHSGGDSEDNRDSEQLGEPGKPGDPDLEPFVQNVLGMCLRESVTNIVKHSKAARCEIGLVQEPHAFTMTISDNGIGLEQEGIWTHGAGLSNMKERIALVNGSLELTAVHGKGTRVRLTIPKIARSLSTGEGVQ